MTISANVRKELFEMTSSEGKLIRIKPTEAKAGTTVYSSKQSQPLKMWTQEEHENPWKVIAAYIGTKTTRQTMTHAQKYRQKISRWRRGLRHKGRKQSGDGMPDSPPPTDACSAKENLFKAIEYVSGDDMKHYEDLFKLAELASIEVMKSEMDRHNPADADSSPYYRGAENDQTRTNADWYCQAGNESEGWGIKSEHEQVSAPPSAHGIAPARYGSDPAMYGQYAPPQVQGNDMQQLGEMPLHMMARGASCALQSNQLQSCHYGQAGADKPQGSFKLPPLNIGGKNGNFSIPPLRSKIDPSVFKKAQYASSQ
ncbi:TPA: hypothetical protein N0F65_008721 [Lagenidium giganteum]|uniref:Myb-like domain-containing protein n=1 Tax=Lagenidium giganteum TaxID=4803 RepID=A0AAV2YM97_9STRA|nr:TPA: hypothetical protein N0F65_008721 [Lagenidium giganteum]